MAEAEVTLNPGSGGALVRTQQVLEGGNNVHQQVVTGADASGNLLDGSGRIQGAAHVPVTGTGGGTANAAGSGRVVNVWAFANGADGTITFHGGTLDTVVVTVRSGTSFAWTPGTEQTATTSAVFSGSLDFLIEWA